MKEEVLMDLSQYMELFLAEAQEHLESLNENLIKLEKNPKETSLINEIFRSAHTLKGMAATMGFEQIAELTHEMEDALTLFKEGKLSVTPDVIDVLLRCLDTLELMIKDISENNQETRYSRSLIDELRALSKRSQLDSTMTSTEDDNSANATLGSIEQFDLNSMPLNDYDLALIKEAEKSGKTIYYIKIGIAPNTVMKSVRVFMVFKSLEEYGDIIKCHPSVQELEEENFEDSFELLFLTQFEKEEIIQALEKISEINILTFQQINAMEFSLSSWNVNVNNNNNEENNKYKEENNKYNDSNKTIPVAPRSQNSNQSTAGLHLKTVRVDIERLDNLMNLVGELVINKTRLEQIGLVHRIPELIEAIEQMGRLTTDLQSLVMKVRMVPIEQVFNRFPRMVRDLARELGKDVEFVIEGKETELDRTVIDEIGDPLVHLLRNALDHGIELPEDRVKVGKSATAHLRLTARHEGNSVIIEVEDDGRGIDIEKVKARAVEKGFITEKEKDYFDDSSILKLIFQPGFSTAEKVTDLSGRGVGLDVVKSKIESLNGNITIDTKLNVGTKVKINLPLTLAIIQALLVGIGDEKYAIPLNSIDETTFIQPEQIKTMQNQEVMILRGTVLPLIRLERILNVPQRALNNEELYVVVTRKGEQRIGLVVDSLVGQQEIVIKSLGKLLSGIKGIAGATILGNGEVALILDVTALLS